MASAMSMLRPPLPHPHNKLQLEKLTASNLTDQTRPLAVPKTTVKVDQPTANLAGMWREIQGSSDWDRLVDPLNPLLRSEIIRYGEFVAACYKAFDLDPKSSRYLNCKYGKRSMLASVGMERSGYEVTKYVYATPDIAIPMQSGNTCTGRWIGYVAVSSDEEGKKLGRRDILVSFRGTVTNTEWIANMMSSLTPARLDPHDPRPDVRVESGFLSLYTSHDSTSRFSQGSCRQQLLSEISRLINKYVAQDAAISITLTGHSMGSSLALLLAYDLGELGLHRNVMPITVYSFGGPRVGNLGFKKRCEELGVKVLRVVNVNDPVTKMPGVFLNESFRVLGGKCGEMPWISCSCYAHVGVELALDFFKVENPSCVHDLETYIGLLKRAKMVQLHNKGVDLVSKAKEFARSRKFDVWQWNHAARQVGELVQSLGF